MSDPDREERKREYNRLAQREFRKSYSSPTSPYPLYYVRHEMKAY